jgi:hypothetical protein
VLSDHEASRGWSRILSLSMTMFLKKRPDKHPSKIHNNNNGRLRIEGREESEKVTRRSAQEVHDSNIAQRCVCRGILLASMVSFARVPDC